jgi:hypothetical protein
MFKITPIQDKHRQKEICALFGVEFRNEAFAYIMFDIDTDALMGMSQFEIGEVGYIYDIKEAAGLDDFEAMFILARQTMNFIDLCGAHTCLASKNAAPERLLLAAGFKEQNGELFCNMTGMFDGNCGGHK